MSNTYNVSIAMLDAYSLLVYNTYMELRELKYFLEIARQENISKAAEALYITQPSLSRQMQNLEKEIGKPLFIRGSKKITLTETGVLLKKRAEELMELYDKTCIELTSSQKGYAEKFTSDAVKVTHWVLLRRQLSRWRRNSPI